MVNEGMTYELTLDQFTLRGVVGGEARLLMHPGCIFDGESGGATITGRRSIEDLVDKLYRLQTVAAELNGNKGPWAYSFASIAKEAGSDGVPVQDMA